MRTAEEAEYAGPWKLAGREDGVALTRLYEEAGGDRPPEGLFADLATALRFYAVLPAVSRPPLIEIDSESAAGWYAVRSEGAPVGKLRVFHDRFADAAHVAEAITRSPLSLAALLLAAGPQAIREVGRILQRLSRSAFADLSGLGAEFPPR